MIKLVLKEYYIQGRVVDQEKGTSEMRDLPYNVKQSIAGLLFHPDLRLTMREALLRKDLADQIENCKEDSILVTKEDFDKIKSSFEKVQGFGRNDLSLLERIEHAEEIEVDLSERKD